MATPDLPRPLTEEQAAEEERNAKMHHMKGHVEATRGNLTKLNLETTKRIEAGEVPFGLS